METVFIILISIAILLFILSFFQNDPIKQIREEIDQLSIQYLQEMYQMKKKIKILEELLVSDIDIAPSFTKDSIVPTEKTAIHNIIKNQVWALAQQGIPLKQIADQSSLTMKDVQTIILEFSQRK